LKRLIDLIISILLLILLFIPCLIISIIIILDTRGPVFFTSNRIGKNKKIFKMYKFRTMHVNAPVINSNEFNEADRYITKFGKYLRKYSLDEFPQIINIIQGDMSLVGPRPALDNQYKLIEKREVFGIFKIKPGLTGLAQVNGRDNLSIDEKVKYDNLYISNQSIIFDIKILIQTITVVLKSKDIRH